MVEEGDVEDDFWLRCEGLLFVEVVWRALQSELCVSVEGFFVFFVRFCDLMS